MRQGIQFKAIYTVAFLLILTLLAAATQIWRDYDVIRTVVASGFLLLTFFALAQRYYVSGAVFLAIAILFTPFLNVIKLPADIWELVDLLALIPIALFTRRVVNPHSKGIRFEQYVLTLFPSDEYEIKDRTRDISKVSKRYVESDTHPDFVFKNRKTGQIFAVECKWRAKWAGDNAKGFGLYWNLEQAARYKEFGIRNQVPVTVCFGIGGHPDKPKEICSLPLEELRWPFLKQSFIRQGQKTGSDHLAAKQF